MHISLISKVVALLGDRYVAEIEREPQYHTALTQGGEVHLDQSFPSSAAIQCLQFFLAQTLIAIACVPYSLDLAILLIACINFTR